MRIIYDFWTLSIGWTLSASSLLWKKLSVSGGGTGTASRPCVGRGLWGNGHGSVAGLRTLHFGSLQPVEHFVAARQVSGHPVVVQHTLFVFIWNNTLDESHGYSVLYSAASS